MGICSTKQTTTSTNNDDDSSSSSSRVENNVVYNVVSNSKSNANGVSKSRGIVVAVCWNFQNGQEALFVAAYWIRNLLSTATYIDHHDVLTEISTYYLPNEQRIKDKLLEIVRTIQNLYKSRDAVEKILLSLYYTKFYINTALTTYEVMAEVFEINKHLENMYDLELVTEMITILRAKGLVDYDDNNNVADVDDEHGNNEQRIKDKLIELTAIQNLYKSRDAVEKILLSLFRTAFYINTALTMYEAMAEMFEINKSGENIYDLELVTEMIMILRAKDTEKGQSIE